MPRRQAWVKLGLHATLSKLHARFGDFNHIVETALNCPVQKLIRIGSCHKHASRRQAIKQDQQLVGDAANLAHILGISPVNGHAIELVHEQHTGAVAAYSNIVWRFLPVLSK